ncbi:MAG: NADH/ubiquinone/plastoquinone (complex I), partial [SAR202 cluster bacterium]|nr:NADH/ubiquinone/plastoquinone (complex I) [SAR202 cluster bacterium]
MTEHLPIIIPMSLVVMALVVPVVAMWRPGLAFPLAAGGIAVSAAASVAVLLEVIDGGAVSYRLGGWPPPQGIELVIDEAGAFVAGVIALVALVVVVGTRRTALAEMGDRLGPFYALVLLFVGGLAGIVVTGDLFNLFVFLEITSIAGYALVFMGGRLGMLAGFRYLILGSIGGMLYLLGVGFVYYATGTLNMADALERIPATASPRAVQAGAIFIFTGLGLKMALVPLHLWLPDAYTHAPSSVNTLIAPIGTKVAAFAMLRMHLSVFPPGYLRDAVPVDQSLIVLGSVGIVYGSVLAVSQRDIRRVLAYSSISQIAMVAVGIGLGTPLGYVAALLHIMNHAVMKASLFMATTSIRLATGLGAIASLAGLGRRMPATMLAFTLGAIAMVGVPPAAGFFSKWTLAQASADQGLWAVVAIVLGSSLLTAAYLFRVLERAYLEPASPDAPAQGDGHHEARAAGAGATGPEHTKPHQPEP